MCSKRKLSFGGTVTFRLTLLYVVLLALLLIAVLIPIDFSLRSIMMSRLDARIAGKLGDFSYYGSLLERKPEEGPGIISDSITWSASNEGEGKVLWVLLSAQREVVVSSDMASWQNELPSIIDGVPELPSRADLPDPLPARLPSDPAVTLLETTGVKQMAALKTTALLGPQRKARVAYLRYSNGMIMVGVYSLQDINRLMGQYLRVLTLAFGIVLVVGGGLGFFIARRAMAGVRQVTQTALNIGKGDLGRRVEPESHGHEIAEMALAFNGMLDRIEALIRELGETTNNVAHDLRSPITRIRGLAETTLASHPSSEDLHNMGAEAIRECDRLIEMINTMLEIAQLDSGLSSTGDARVDMVELVDQALDLFGPVAEDKHQVLELAHDEPHLWVQGNLNGLQRMVANLLDNAIKFTPAQGRIHVSLTAQDQVVMLRVQDSGIGIEPDRLPHVFKRFYRGDKSRSTAGNGLGLSLAQATARSHKGSIAVTSVPGQGSAFTVTLPQS